MSLSSRAQLLAFLALIASVLVLGLAPVVTAGIMGKSLPDSLIAVSDKTVTGLVGVLGTIAAMIFRTNQNDDKRIETTQTALQGAREAVAAVSAQNGGAPNVILKPGETAQAEEPAP